MVKTKGQITALADIIGSSADFIAQRMKDAGMSSATIFFSADTIHVTAMENMKDDSKAVHQFYLKNKRPDNYDFSIMTPDGDLLA